MQVTAETIAIAILAALLSACQPQSSAVPVPPTPIPAAPPPSASGAAAELDPSLKPELAIGLDPAAAALADQAAANWPAIGQRPDPMPWADLARDGLHDANNPALRLLQNPREGLSPLPPSRSGNFVDWTEALRADAIKPRANVSGTASMKILALDIVLADTRSMPTVTFRHAAHTEWLDCKDCHEAVFISKRGANSAAMTMAGILKGEYCGRCHGKVAFPPTQCFDCHNAPRPGQRRIPGP